jgi:hypothetical protein
MAATQFATLDWIDHRSYFPTITLFRKKSIGSGLRIARPGGKLCLPEVFRAAKGGVWLGGLIALTIAGLAISQEKAPQKRPATKAVARSVSSTTNFSNSELTIVGYLEQRDRTIVIKASPRGAVYTVKSADGKVLLDNLSLQQIQAQAPELHEFLKNAVTKAPGNKTDASLRPRADVSLR